MSNVRIVLVGDSAVGLKYTGVAAHKARALRALPHATRKTHWVPLGEVTLRIELDDLAGDVVYIDTTVSCPPTQYAGFVDTWAPDSAYLKGKPKRVEELQNLDEQRVARMQRVGNTDPDKIRLLPETGLPSEEWEELPADPVMSGMRLAEPVNNEYPKVKVDMPVLEQEWRKFFDEHKPSKYSGLMRRVLQATFALDDWADRLTYVVGEGENRRREFLLNYKWGDSWGVVLAPGKDGSHGSHYFLIWVTTGEVFWVPATFCVTEAELDGQTVFVPVIGGIQRTEAVSLGTISYVGAAVSAELGWAFSYTSAEAAHVLYDMDGYDPRLNVRNVYYNTKLATLGLTFAQEIPVAATIETTEPKRFWSHLRNDKNTAVANPVGVLNVPGAGGKYIETVDLRNFPAPYINDYSAENVPVHVWYVEGEPNPKVVSYMFDRAEATTDVRPAPTSAAEAFNGHSGTKSEAAHTNWGFSIGDWGPPKTRGARADSHVTYTLGGPCLPYHYSGGTTAKVYSWDVVFTHTEDWENYGWFGNLATEMRLVPGTPTCHYNSAGYEYPEGSTTTVQKSYTVRAGVYRGHTYPTGLLNRYRQMRAMNVDYCAVVEMGGGQEQLASCTLPCGDREAAVLLTSTVTHATSRTETHAAKVTWFNDPAGPYWGQPTFTGVSYMQPTWTGVDSFQAKYLFASPEPQPGDGDAMAAIVALQLSFYARYGIPICAGIRNVCALPAGETNYEHPEYSWPFGTAAIEPTARHHRYYVCDGIYYATYTPTGVNVNPDASLNSTVATVLPASEDVRIRAFYKGVSEAMDPLVWANALQQVYDANDNFQLQLSVSAFSGAAALPRAPMRTVVRMGNKEYNVEHAVFGWLGVV